jgi:hypothetical protein
MFHVRCRPIRRKFVASGWLLAFDASTVALIDCDCAWNGHLLPLAFDFNF